MSKTLSAENFKVDEMWMMSQRSNQTWGVSGYEVPAEHFDYQRHALDKENFLKSVGKKKRAAGSVNKEAKRGDIFYQIEKRSKELPGPWKYDIKDTWMTGYKKNPNAMVASKNRQLMKFKWKKGTQPEENNLEKPPNIKPGKPDMKHKKNTYIDEIFHDNSRKMYPKPGPGTYWKDKILLKKVDPEVAEILKVPEVKTTKANNLPKAKREMTFINLKEAASKPAPGHVSIFVKKIKEAALGYKAYKNKRVEDKNRQKETVARNKEWMESITEKIKTPVPKFPEPLESSFITFQKLALKYAKVKKGGDKKGQPFFGREERYGKSPDEKWKKTVDLYNAASIGKTLDAKKDPEPGPAHYSLIASWSEYEKKDKNKKNKLPNIFNKMTKTPDLGTYNQRRYN